MPLPLSSTTTFPVEQPAAQASPFKGAWELPSLSDRQECAIQCIKRSGKDYVLHPSGHWQPANWERLSEDMRAVCRATNRTIISLIRNGWLTATNQINGRPVRVTLTFP